MKGLGLSLPERVSLANRFLWRGLQTGSLFGCSNIRGGYRVSGLGLSLPERVSLAIRFLWRGLQIGSLLDVQTLGEVFRKGLYWLGYKKWPPKHSYLRAYKGMQSNCLYQTYLKLGFHTSEP